MNASEARLKANENLPKVVDTRVYIAVVAIDNCIKEAVQTGNFTTSKELALPKAIESEVINRLETHYKEFGYEVDTRDYFNRKLIQISWGDNN